MTHVSGVQLTETIDDGSVVVRAGQFDAKYDRMAKGFVGSAQSCASNKTYAEIMLAEQQKGGASEEEEDGGEAEGSDAGMSEPQSDDEESVSRIFQSA